MKSWVLKSPCKITYLILYGNLYTWWFYNWKIWNKYNYKVEHQQWPCTLSYSIMFQIAQTCYKYKMDFQKPINEFYISQYAWLLLNAEVFRLQEMASLKY